MKRISYKFAGLLLLAAVLFCGALTCAFPQETPLSASTPTPKPVATYTPPPTSIPVAMTSTPTPKPVATHTLPPTSIPVAMTSTPTPKPVATYSPTPTSIPVATTSTPTPQTPYDHYEHYRDRQPIGSDGKRNSRACNDNSTNFSIHLPPQWEIRSTGCDYAEFEEIFEGAQVEAYIDRLADYYNDDPAKAIVTIASNWSGGEYALPGSRLPVKVKVISTTNTVHHDQPAFRQQQTLALTEILKTSYCVTRQDAFVVLSESWSTNKVAYVIIASRCEDNAKHNQVIDKMLKSFRELPSDAS